MGNSIRKMAFPVPEPVMEIKDNFQYLTTTDGSQFPVIFIKYANNAKTIVFSHGNATDLGRCIPYLKYLSRQLRVNVVGYEYLGYGLSNCCDSDNESSSFSSSNSKYPCESGCYETLDVTYKWITTVLGIVPANIILLGQSIGCGPTVEIANRYPLAAMILVTPFKSAVKVVSESMMLGMMLDFFENDKKMAHVGCPILIIHGTQDSVIPHHHSETLTQMSGNCRLVLIEGADHNDLDNFPEFILTLQNFLNN
jgi:pimeloyl-ACP methyl ester carboxylesterase